MTDKAHYKKQCSKCGKDQTYTDESNFNVAVKLNTLCKSCRNKVRILSDEARAKISLRHMGNTYNLNYKHSETTKINMRIARAKRFQSLGIPARSDVGASEWFQWYNMYYNFAFKENLFFSGVGYYADGYDRENHIWIEYDTKYHKSPYMKKRDQTRQDNIIKHFESIGKPLNEFKRVLAYNNWEVITPYSKH